jgi:integrase
VPKIAKELHAKVVAALKGNGRHAVGGAVGLHLRIEGKNRWWVLRIKVGNRRRDLGLGRYPEISLADARDLAREKRNAVSAPTMIRAQPTSDPVFTPPQPLPRPIAEAPPMTAAQSSDQGDKASPTFEFCAKKYIAAQEPGWKSRKHGKQWLSTLETYAFPVIGKLHPSAVTSDHILQILRPIWATKTETATRVRGRMESILDWAAHKGYRQGANPARWDGNLRHELPSPTRLKKRKQRHHPALPYIRLGAFMVDLRLREGVSARALEWGILNAARFQEIAGARRCEVDLQLKRWTIPAERMKREIEHVVPLSDEALAVFNSLPPGAPDDLLFPAPEGGLLCDSALGAMIDGIHETDLARGGMGYMDPKEGRIATQHGFRSTFRDWASEIAYFDKEIVEHAIAHKLKDKAEAAYQRGTLLMKRALLMDQWGRFCRTPEFCVGTMNHPTMQAA